ncbi:DUF1365 domain-containing protein [Solimonas variicoloris]|uniref:DUF1365 domain-containing protein n=1 Tax=Solimonas variicoloris TaxID=254408 RepID=UPI00037D477B|nr:DUF1365 domain-containing protein [Solimonas variicoloris]
MGAPVTPRGEAGCLYEARVMHRRRVAPLYRFVYRVFYLFVDVDRVDELAGRLRGFSHNRFNLLSLHDADHGDGRGLRAWAEALLQRHGIALDGGRIRLLAFPRVLGHAFNPLSLWYCEHADGSLRAVIAEVRNTFGERHSYLLARGGAPLAYGEMPAQDKCFHVSPFFALTGRYRFALDAPDARLRVHIALEHGAQPRLDATITGSRVPLRDATLVRAVARLPWLALKVLGAIHWQALKLWLRGARVHARPSPPGIR